MAETTSGNDVRILKLILVPSLITLAVTILRVVGDRLVFAPPLVIEASEIEEISERLERALDDVAKDLKTEGALG